MRSSSRVSLLFLLLAGACATAGGGRGRAPAIVHQADERIPPLSAFEPGAQRTAYNEALTHEQRGWQLESSGDAAGAREPLEAAARGYLTFVERFPNTGWDVLLRYHAADLLRRAQKHDDAIAQAEQVMQHPRASPKSKAMAALQLANANVGAGKLEALKIVPAGEREGAPQPKQVPEQWQRFLDAADAYLQGAAGGQAEPTDRTLSAGQIALVAARVAYAHDDMEGARRRLASILERWAGDHQVFAGAAPLYVQTFMAAGDHEGAQSAIARVRETASAQAQQATADDARAAYEKVASETERVASSVRYERAKALLEEGKHEEAARAFEAVVREEGGDDAAALVGAAIAWDRAGNPERAAALRHTILEEHADSRVAPGAALQLAAYLSKKGDHAGSARVYGLHAERWADDPNHCTALRNGAVELDLAKEAAEAAERYRAFGSEQRCAEASPDVAAIALHRAGQLYLQARQRAEAREAFLAASQVEGVSTPDAKRSVSDARAQAKRLGGTAAGRRAPSR